jgi:endo-1,4-beta-xylanase
MNITQHWQSLSIVLVATFMIACGGGGGDSTPPPVSSSSSSSSAAASSSSSSASSVTPLKSIAVAPQNQFLIGVAVAGGDDVNSPVTNIARQTVVKTHFDSIVAENIMKMRFLHPTETTFSYTDADALVNFAISNNIKVHGHTFIWHNDYQVPAWMTNYVGDAAAWKTMLDNHVSQIAGHFSGKVMSWDVVNEAIDDASPAGYRNSLFYQKLGKDYIKNAFVAARAADGAADLYYNDYNIEDGTSSKTAFMLAMIDELKAANVPINGVGFQMHVTRTYPAIANIEAAFKAVVDRGLKVRISEMDVRVNNGSTVLTSLSPADAESQKQRYKEIVAAYKKVVPISQRGGITFWGINDGTSWLISFYNRPEWPLLFNDDFTTKPAFDGVAEAWNIAVL